MKRALTYLVLVLLLMLAGESRAQQLPLYSQYLLNGFMINPAMAGYDGYTSFNATVRQQWLGFENAPQTYSAAWHARMYRRSHRIVKNPIRHNNLLIPSTRGRVGLGAYVINDLNAQVARTGLAFSYAYHIPMADRQLSFGLSIKAFQYRIYTEHLEFGEEGDPVLNGNFKKVGYSPDADVGVYYYHRKYFAGFAASNLLQTAVIMGGNHIADFKTFRHYWIVGGYKFDLNREFQLEPSVLLKTTENWNPQGDFSLRLYFNDLFWAGLSYRTNRSIIAVIGVRVERIYFGYSFDYSLAEIGNFNWGSHEITISAKIGDNARRYRWLNRY